MNSTRRLMGAILVCIGLCLSLPLAAGAAESGEEILAAAGVRGGLVVVVGCEDVDLLIDLASRKGCLVQGLDTRGESVEQATAALRAEGLLGRASVTRFNGHSLPYVDNLVNLLVIQQADTELAEAEIQRVLAPRGVALIAGKRIVKPVPPQIDEWTHHMYDASGVGAGRDRAVSRPRSIQWKAGPEYSRSHENMSSVSAVVSARGRVFAIMDEGPAASIYLPSRWFLTARDAFSGVLLWKVPIRRWHARLFPLKSGPQQLPRRLVAVGDHVYVTLGIDSPVSELDAATGRSLRTFSGTEHAEELLISQGRLLVVVNAQSAALPYRGRTPENRPGFTIEQRTLNLGAARSVVMVDLRTGRPVWKTPPGPIVPLTMASDARRVFFLRGGELVAVDLGNGETAWTQVVARKEVRFGTALSPTLLVYKDVVYLAVQGKLTAREAATGRAMWSAPCATSGYRAPASIFVVNDLIWDVAVGGEPYRPGSDLNKINRTYTGFDLCTGRVVKTIPVSAEHGYAIMHHRCHVPRASGGFIITSFPGIEFFDVETGRSTHDSWLRGACLYGFMPANGLIYAPPHPCACYTQGKLTGFYAVAGPRNRPAPDSPADRLEKGPAFEAPRAPAVDRPAADDWPTYRGDAARSGTTSAPIPLSIKQLWHTKVGPNLSQCVIADGRLFVATTEARTVHALDAANGRPLWQFTATGRVDSAPTYYQGTVLFGSRDGYVYCLRADSGELVWRFRAAPIDQRCVAYDQVESVWPVHGSVLIHNGVLWCCAGRSSFLDSGLFVHRLDPRTGRLLSTTRIDSLGEDQEQPPISPTMFARLDMEGAKNDVLSCGGRHVFMRHWAFDLQGKSVPQDKDHLFSPTGFLDASWFRRTYWIYGRMYVSGAQGWARTGNVRPSGRIMSIDEQRIYGFGRDYYPPSPGPGHQMYLAGEQERLFAVARNSRAVPLDGAEAAPRRKPAAAAGQGLLWSMPADLQVRAMLLAGRDQDKRLYVAGAKGDWVISQDAYEGKLGNLLRVVSIEDGATQAEYELPARLVFDGMSAAGGRLFMALETGDIVCWSPADR